MKNETPRETLKKFYRSEERKLTKETNRDEAKSEWSEEIASDLSFQISFWQRKLRRSNLTEKEIASVLLDAVRFAINHEENPYIKK